MIFVGDIAIPYLDIIILEDFPENLLKKMWFGNLEGTLIKNQVNTEQSDIRAVFNGFMAIKNMTNKFNYIGFALANNHIFDAGSYLETKENLDQLNVKLCGIGNNFTEACKPLVLREYNIEIVIVNLGWEVIQCNITRGNKEGVAPLTKENALQILANVKYEKPNAKIIFFMHWSYELEAHPQPRERELAKFLIDNGADGIIGSHPHRIGEFEIYKGKPIIYSLGNWMFKQNYYFNGKLKFPDFCNKEIAFEWDFKNNIMKIHHFVYEKRNSSLSYVSTDIFDENFVSKNSLIYKLTNQEYKEYYKKNHYHRNKGLPIYYWEDSKFRITMKNNINCIRDFILKITLKIYLK